MPGSDGFYRDLPVLPSLTGAMDGQRHRELPPDWWLLIADVVDSTGAIDRGAYKAVNTVGAACIAAVCNIDRESEVPYLFGGDGATFALPGSLQARAIVALRGAQRMAQAQFGLSLRAGLVAVADLASQGHAVRLCKTRLSDALTQPVFSGRGFAIAEQWVKSADAPGVVRIRPQDEPAEASFEGFECRWRNVPSFNDHKLTLIVAATSADEAVNLATYRRVIAAIETLFGDFSRHHPLRPEGLRLGLLPRQLAHEWRVRHGGRGALAGAWAALRLFAANVAGMLLLGRTPPIGASLWRGYRRALVENSDFRKFDGVLRMVVDATAAQAAALEATLAAEAAAGYLAYGLHKSREALVTCLVESRASKHIHFVDGSDGGYVAAARQLKAALARPAT